MRCKVKRIERRGDEVIDADFISIVVVGQRLVELLERDWGQINKEQMSDDTQQKMCDEWNQNPALYTNRRDGM